MENHGNLRHRILCCPYRSVNQLHDAASETTQSSAGHQYGIKRLVAQSGVTQDISTLMVSSIPKEEQEHTQYLKIG